MALFKILRGPSTSLSKQTIIDGYCYFTPDDQKFYVDYSGKRVPLNAEMADRLLAKWTDSNGSTHKGYATLVNAINDSVSEIPTSKAIFTRFAEFEAEVDSEIASLKSLKMDKANPTGTGSLSINRKSGTTTGSNSVAIGNNNTASKPCSVAIGNSNTASGDYSMAEGNTNTASGNASHAEGSSNIASGAQSHAEGNGTQAIGSYSHAGGQGTIASGTAATAIGKYNTNDVNQAFIVGNGTSNANKSDAFKVDWNGNSVSTGTVGIGGGSATLQYDSTNKCLNFVFA